MPPAERLGSLARHKASMVIFLSVGMIDQVVEELLQGYSENTPCVVIEKASWPGQRVIRGSLKDIAALVKEAGVKKTALTMWGMPCAPPRCPWERNRGSTTRVFPMASGNRTVCLYITEKGRTLAQTISGLTPEGVCEPFSSDAVKRHWAKGTNLVFVMAAGIVVRTIAPLLGNKRVDPAVVVLDDSGEHAISLLSGHGGGANALAMEIGRLVGAQPVITTASDKNGLPSIDLWAERSGLAIENWKALPKKGRKLVDEGALRVFSDVAVDLPEAYEPAADASDADIVVTNRIASTPFRRDAVILRPGNLTAGIGCNAGTDAREIEDGGEENPP